MTRPRGPSSRINQQNETRLLAEWIAVRHPTDDVRQHVFVGPTMTGFGDVEIDPVSFRMLGVRRRWVDAVILYPDRTELVEAKIVPDVIAIAQLTLYKRLFPQTDEFRDRSTMPVSLRILSAVVDPILSTMIAEAGINEELFHPSWVDDYLNTKLPNKRKVPAMGK